MNEGEKVKKDTCPICSGEGNFYNGDPAAIDTEVVTCYRCNGSGRIPILKPSSKALTDLEKAKSVIGRSELMSGNDEDSSRDNSLEAIAHALISIAESLETIAGSS